MIALAEPTEPAWHEGSLLIPQRAYRDEQQSAPYASEAYGVSRREGLAVDEHSEQQGYCRAEVLDETQHGERNGIGCRREQEEWNGSDDPAADQKQGCLPALPAGHIAQKRMVAIDVRKDDGNGYGGQKRDEVLEGKSLGCGVAAFLLDPAVYPEAQREHY